MDLKGAIIPQHAAERMARRGVSENELRGVLERPEGVFAVREGRVVAQSLRGAWVGVKLRGKDKGPGLGFNRLVCCWIPTVH